MYGSTLTLINNTIASNHNTASSSVARGAGIYAYEAGADVSGCNNILYHNTATTYPEYYGNVEFTYSCVSTGMTGTGNITQNPLFVDIVHNDYHLQEQSPCIDTGDPESPSDPDGTRADMGALYYHQSANIGSYQTNKQPITHILLSNYPNPFNPTTTISFDLPIQSYVIINIYNVLGHRVGVLMDGTMSQGIHRVQWDGSAYPSGIYFIRASTEEFVQMQKMVLLK